MFSPLTKQLITALQKLPGIGPKSAQRIACQLLSKRGRDNGLNLAHAMQQALNDVQQCEQCQNYTEHARCDICQNSKRNPGILCIVENPTDVIAVEQTHNYNGHYFVLHGHLSPLDNIGPLDLGIPKLVNRLKQAAASEVIIATSSTMEGEATAHYLANQLAPLGIRCSRIAHGVPIGGELEYLDSNTLIHAFQSRISLSEEVNHV